MISKILYPIAAILLLSGIMNSQNFRVVITSGYQLGGAVDETEQEEGVFQWNDALGISGSAVFGSALGFRLSDKLEIELSWDRQFSRLNFYKGTGSGVEDRTVNKLSNLKVDYLLAGLIYDWSDQSLRPFAGIMAGIVRMIPNENFDTEARFTLAPLIGIRLSLNHFLTLRAHSRFMITPVSAGKLFQSRNENSFEYFHLEDSFMIQYQIGIGLSIKF